MYLITAEVAWSIMRGRAQGRDAGAGRIAEAGGERGSQADETEHSFRRARNDDEDW